MKTFKTIKSGYRALGQRIGVSVHAPSARQAQVALFVFGIAVLAGGLCLDATAAGLQTRYNDVRVSNSVNAVLTYLEGTFGALIMVAAGIGAIMSAAFGQYRAALGCLVVAVGSFILRSFLGTFFNDEGIQA